MGMHHNRYLTGVLPPSEARKVVLEDYHRKYGLLGSSELGVGCEWTTTLSAKK